MKTIRIFTVITVFLAFSAKAQDQSDALLLSQVENSGTGRYSAMSGALGADGRDFSAISTNNPAGVSTFGRLEIALTPSFFWKQSSSLFLNETSSDRNYAFNFRNIGAAYSHQLGGKYARSWSNVSLSFGYNKLAQFDSRELFRGINEENSIVDSYLEEINTEIGTRIHDLNPMGAGLLFQVGVIDTLPGFPRSYAKSVNADTAGMLQRRASFAEGSLGEVVIAGGATYGNYGRNIHLGLAVGLPRINYQEEVIYKEEAQGDTLLEKGVFTNEFELSRRVSRTGKGINFKIGAIYDAADWLSLGIAFHSPTFFNFSDSVNASARSVRYDGLVREAQSPESQVSYEAQTPLKLIGSVTFRLREAGIVAIDVERLSYSEARLRSSAVYFEENDQIQKYSSVFNFRVGTELDVGRSYGQDFKIRAGYANYGDPYSGNLFLFSRSLGAGFNTQTFSAGCGLAWGEEIEYFLDFAYIFSYTQGKYTPYTLRQEEVPIVSTEESRHNIVLTFGVRF